MKIKLPFDVPETFSGLTVERLTELETFAVQAAKPLRTKSADEVTDDDVETLRALADVVANVRAARAEHDKQAEDADKRKADFAALADTFATKTDDKADEKADEDEADAETDAADEEEEAADEAAAAKKDKKAVTAGAGRKAPRVADVAKGNKLPTMEDQRVENEFFSIVAAADVPGFPSGAEFGSDLDLGRAIEARLASYSGRKSGSGQHGVAVIKRNLPSELVQGNGSAESDMKLLEYAASEARLPGGSLIAAVEAEQKRLEGAKSKRSSLIAAAGWCAPSQTVYDLFELETGRDGMVDIPQIQITRGGINFTPGPDFATIFAGTGYFHQTEAQVIAATTKPCMVVPCPSFTDVRLEVEGVCITGAILQSRGYPEMVARFTRGAMAVHNHKLNKFVIDKMVAGSTVVDLSPAPVATSVFADDPTTTGMLAAIEMGVEDYRYRHRMPFGSALEAVFPHWVLPVIRADWSRRTGVDMTNVSDAQILAHFTARGIRPQFVYDWQDSFAGTAAGPGGASALQDFPQEVTYLLYAAGTWVRGVADVITLDTVYDAANLALNQFTALFTEEGVLVAKMGHDSRAYTVPLCPSGTTSATTAMNCS
jgi:hypothetical protein